MPTTTNNTPQYSLSDQFDRLANIEEPTVREAFARDILSQIHNSYDDLYDLNNMTAALADVQGFVAKATQSVLEYYTELEKQKMKPKYETDFNPERYDLHRSALAQMIYLRAIESIDYKGHFPDLDRAISDPGEYVPGLVELAHTLKGLGITSDNFPEFYAWVKSKWDLNPRHLDIFDVSQMERTS